MKQSKLTCDTAEKEAISRLREIPGVGPKLASGLFHLGYASVADLKDADPEAMYQRLMDQLGHHVDRCVLYVYRCAVYYASNTQHEPEKLKWWTWKE